jgi:predicted nucleic acid-binding protein
VTTLPDVNVLTTIAWPAHVHHAAALKWFDENADAGWATAVDDPAAVGRRLHGFSQVIDAHLIHLADTNGGTPATFDRAAPTIAGEDHITVLAGG